MIASKIGDQSTVQFHGFNQLIMTPLLLILTLINAAHGMAKGIKHEVASTHAQDQLSDPKATTGAANFSFFNSFFLF